MKNLQRILISVALGLAATTARANTPEDIYGVSGRTVAMGGAGTALPGDHAATHYNPAGLANCRDDLLAFDSSAIVHSLGFTDKRGGTAKLAPRATRDQGRFTLGGCLSLPFDLGLGFTVGFGHPGAVTIDQQTANERPEYVLYGLNHEQISVGAGLGWRPARWLALGVGFAALVHSELPVVGTIPVTVPDPEHPGQNEPVDFSVSLGMGGRLAARLGLLVSPLERLRFGVAYRGSLYHDLKIETDLKVKTVLVDVLVPLHMDLLSWFSPEQISVGASGEPLDFLTLTADVTWYHYGALADNTYPFLNIYSTGKPGSPAEALVFPTVERPGWQDVIAIRLGTELRLLGDRIALRAGVGRRGSAVDSPDDSNVNLLDGPVITASGGLGVYFGRKAPPPGRLPDPGPRPRKRVWKYDIPDYRASLEAFVRLDEMATRTVRHASSGAGDPVPEKNYEFGGRVVQLGLTATLGW